MRSIWIVFRKELLDTLRDRRTIISMIVVPLIAFPLLMTVTGRISASQKKKAEAKTLSVAVLGGGSADVLRDSLRMMTGIVLRQDVEQDSIQSYLQQERLDAAIEFSSDFDQKVENLEKGAVRVSFKSSDDFSRTRQRIRELLQGFEKQLLDVRYRKLALNQNVAKVMDLREVNVTSEQEKIGQTIGGFLPYILILFCFTGCLYPAIDLGAGEKERGTIETLLTAPATRLQILIGKFGVVVLTGLFAAGISLLGLYLGVVRMGSATDGDFSSLIAVLETGTLVMTFALLLPVTVFFAAGLLALSFYARTFKEAQSTIGPVTILIIIPVAIGLIPGMKLNYVTALIPLLNVSLTTKEILAGTITPLLYAEVFGVLFLLAAGALMVSVWWFKREETIFRGS